MYRRAENLKPDGQKKAKEEVFKKDDELPDALRYMLMSWPELPKAPGSHDAAFAARMAAFPEQVRRQIERTKEHRERLEKGPVLELTDKDWPIGDFYAHDAYEAEFGIG